MIAKLTSVALRSTGVLDIGRPLSCAGVYGARFQPLLAASLSAPPWCALVSRIRNRKAKSNGGGCCLCLSGMRWQLHGHQLHLQRARRSMGKMEGDEPT